MKCLSIFLLLSFLTMTLSCGNSGSLESTTSKAESSTKTKTRTETEDEPNSHFTKEEGEHLGGSEKNNNHEGSNSQTEEEEKPSVTQTKKPTEETTEWAGFNIKEKDTPDEDSDEDQKAILSKFGINKRTTLSPTKVQGYISRTTPKKGSGQFILSEATEQIENKTQTDLENSNILFETINKLPNYPNLIYLSLFPQFVKNLKTKFETPGSWNAYLKRLANPEDKNSSPIEALKAKGIEGKDLAKTLLFDKKLSK